MIAFLLPETTNPLSVNDYIFGLLMPILLSVNAIIVTPIIMNSKLDEKKVKLYNRTLLIVSTSSFLFAMLLLHATVLNGWAAMWRDGWIIVGVWSMSVGLVVVLLIYISVVLLFMSVHKSMLKPKDKAAHPVVTNIEGFAKSVFCIAYIIWACLLISITIREVAA